MQGYETDLILLDDITKKVEKYCEVFILPRSRKFPIINVTSSF